MSVFTAHSKSPGGFSQTETAQGLQCLYPKADAPLRLFAFHHMGGGALLFHKWHALMPPSVEFMAVRLSGRETRRKETPFKHYRPLVNDVIRTLLPWLDKPFAFFGHSMGALIGFETARELRRRALPQPVQFFVSACLAPHRIPAVQRWLHLNNDEFVGRLRQYGGLPEQVVSQTDLMEVYLPILRADREVFETYTCLPDAPLSCPIMALAGSADSAVPVDGVLEWQEYTSRQLNHRVFPGGHFFINDFRQELVQTFTSVLNEEALDGWRPKARL